MRCLISTAGMCILLATVPAAVQGETNNGFYVPEFVRGQAPPFIPIAATVEGELASWTRQESLDRLRGSEPVSQNQRGSILSSPRSLSQLESSGPDKEFQPLLGHQAMIGFFHMDAVQTEELRAIWSCGQKGFHFND